jgi:hypothetical protein
LKNTQIQFVLVFYFTATLSLVSIPVYIVAIAPKALATSAIDPFGESPGGLIGGSGKPDTPFEELPTIGGGGSGSVQTPFPNSLTPNVQESQTSQTVQQARQLFALLEQQLPQMSPEQQQNTISMVQQGIMDTVALVAPESRPVALGVFQQVMSPQLAEILVVPLFDQLSETTTSDDDDEDEQEESEQEEEIPEQEPGSQSTALPDLMDECLAAGNSRATCEAALISPGFGICDDLALVNLPCPVQ